MKLKGKHVLVIGGTSGIGLEVAAEVLNEGGEVTVVGRSNEKLSSALAKFGTEASCRGFACDISDEKQVEILYQQVGPFDHLVVTAAGDLVYKPFDEFDLEEVRRVIDHKLIGAYLLVKYAKPLLRDGASVVLTSGINAFIPAGRSAIVSAVNGALIAYVRALAIELRPIRVNSISPGWVNTPIWKNVASDEVKANLFQDLAERLPVGRIGVPKDIATAVMLLLTNGYMTGSTLEVDGGRRLL